MKKLVLALVVISVLAGCGVDSGDPAAVAQAFMDRIINLDFAGAAELATEESAMGLNMMGSLLSQMPEDEKAAMGEAGTVTITGVEVTGDTAVASTTTTVDGVTTDSEPIELVKENGEWKVLFEKDAGF
jgi:hypothetical protein